MCCFRDCICTSPAQRSALLQRRRRPRRRRCASHPIPSSEFEGAQPASHTLCSHGPPPPKGTGLAWTLADTTYAIGHKGHVSGAPHLESDGPQLFGMLYKDQQILPLLHASPEGLSATPKQRKVKVQPRDTKGQLQDPGEQLKQLETHCRKLYAADNDPSVAGATREQVRLDIDVETLTKALATLSPPKSHSAQTSFECPVAHCLRPGSSDNVRLGEAMDSNP